VEAVPARRTAGEIPAIRALFSPVARDRDLSFCATGMGCCMSLPGREQSERKHGILFRHGKPSVPRV